MHLVVPPCGVFHESRKIELGPRPLSIGRAEHCDIRLDVPGVDPEHARISEVAVIAVGQDCAVGDVPLDVGHRRLLMPGDELQIGAVVLVLEGDDPSILPPPPGDDGPRSLSTRAPRIRVVEGSNFGEELVLAEEERLYVLGRSPQCDLVLEDREVSREHMKLARRGTKVFIQDQSSTRGSWLGRAAVHSASTIEWSRPRMLRVGQSVLALEVSLEAGRAANAPAPTLPIDSPRAPEVDPAPVAPSGPSTGPDAETTGRASKTSRPTVGKAGAALMLIGVALAAVALSYVAFMFME